MGKGDMRGSFGKHQDDVGERDRFGNIVRNEKGGLSLAPYDVRDVVADVESRLVVASRRKVGRGSCVRSLRARTFRRV